MTIYGYARVSTDAQDLTAQLDQLKAAGCAKVFREKVSGPRADRPELRLLLGVLEPGDQVLVTRLDRLARSIPDLLATLRLFTEKEAGFKSLAEGWADTSTAAGRLMVVVDGIAEFERELIKARTSEGLRRARLRGMKPGPAPKLSSHQRREAIRRRDELDEPVTKIALDLKVHHSMISRLRA